MKQAGDVYIFLSNDETTPLEVFFDDFKVMHAKGPVVHRRDYYTFGLPFNSFQNESSIANKYNSIERPDELELGWDLARFGGV